MTNPKTTIAGILAGLIPVAQTVYDAVADGKPINWALVGMGAALAIMGYLAQDAKKEK